VEKGTVKWLTRGEKFLIRVQRAEKTDYHAKVGSNLEWRNEKHLWGRGTGARERRWGDKCETSSREPSLRVGRN